MAPLVFGILMCACSSHWDSFLMWESEKSSLVTQCYIYWKRNSLQDNSVPNQDKALIPFLLCCLKSQNMKLSALVSVEKPNSEKLWSFNCFRFNCSFSWRCLIVFKSKRGPWTYFYLLQFVYLSIMWFYAHMTFCIFDDYCSKESQVEIWCLVASVE